MATRIVLERWTEEALKAYRGKASIVDVCRHIWGKHESTLRESGALFFTWQYDVRWAANRLRRKGVMKAAEASPVGMWELRDH